MSRLPDPSLIPTEHAQEMLARIQDILWANGPDTEWNAETMAEVAAVMTPLRPVTTDPVVRKYTYTITLMVPDGPEAPPDARGLAGLLLRQSYVEAGEAEPTPLYALAMTQTGPEVVPGTAVGDQLHLLGYAPNFFEDVFRLPDGDDPA